MSATLSVSNSGGVVQYRNFGFREALGISFCSFIATARLSQIPIQSNPVEFLFTPDGLIPVIVQEASRTPHPTGRVLMFAWMNRESLAKTLESGLMTYWSRSRKKLWLKGETSGHTQRVVRWFVDCDRDVLLFEVEQSCGACHTGYESCFFQELDLQGNPLPVAEKKLFDDTAVYKK
ncbi:MAG: phosphoribosyl-AMP cyclohydrolase [Chthoniobacterales bacterium]|nr:phosphoribosyl-AMP cyclohydrolase [Chthoniobacterales bacterium]